MQTPMIVIFFTGNCSSLLLYAKKEQTKKTTQKPETKLINFSKINK